MKKDYSELDRQVILIDMYEDMEDPDILAGIAIASEDLEAFLRDVRELACTKYGGATFAELLDEDLDDESMDASSKRNFRDRVDALIELAEQIMAKGEDD